MIVDGGTQDWANGRYPLFTEPAPGYHGANFASMLGAQAFIARVRIEGLRDIGLAYLSF